MTRRAKPLGNRSPAPDSMPAARNQHICRRLPHDIPFRIKNGERCTTLGSTRIALRTAGLARMIEIGHVDGRAAGYPQPSSLRR